MSEKLIRDLQPGDAVVSHFIVRKKEIKEQRKNRKLYITFEFGDRSGRIRGSVWNDIEKINGSVHVHDVVKVKGRVITFLNKPHITVENIRVVTKSDGIDPVCFLPVSDHNLDTLYTQLSQFIQAIKQPHLRKLAVLLFDDSQFAKHFRNASAAKLWHHNYLGGLLEHTLSMVQLCDFCADHYAVNRDLLITAALLHDVGKIYELSLNGYIDYTTEGRLLGHITMAVQLITAKIQQIPEFPRSLKTHLLHCILSHHGVKENGSPVLPMTREAMILHAADDLDSRLGAFQRIMKKEQDEDKEWSEYVNLLDRFLYIGEINS